MWEKQMFSGAILCLKHVAILLCDSFIKILLPADLFNNWEPVSQGWWECSSNGSLQVFSGRMLSQTHQLYFVCLVWIMFLNFHTWQSLAAMVGFLTSTKVTLQWQLLVLVRTQYRTNIQCCVCWLSSIIIYMCLYNYSSMKKLNWYLTLMCA